MSNFLTRKLCLQAVTLIVTALLVDNAHSQQSTDGGIFSLGISDDATVGFGWSANTEPDLAGYRLYVGTLPGVYSGYVDAGRVTTCELRELIRGMTYYFALTAYNTAGVESNFSPELTRQIPLADNTLTGITDNNQALQSSTNAPAAAALLDSPPAISEIPDIFLSKNRVSDPIPFTVSDAQTPGAALQLTASSSNPLVVPPSGLILSGSDANRTLVIDPLNGQTGVSIVTLAVTDGASITTLSFQVMVGNAESATHIVVPLE